MGAMHGGDGSVMLTTYVGITRFSVVTFDSLAWFQSTRNLTVEEAKLLVFDRRRLDLRLKIFARFALPTYVALTRQERSYALILVNHDLPSPVRKRLKEMIDPYPNIRLLVLKFGQSFKAPTKKVSAELAEGGRLFSYRMDDDDALAPSYLDVVRAEIDKLPDGTVFSAVDGCIVAPAPGERFQLQRCAMGQLGLGLGVVTSAESEYLSAFHLNSHMTVHQRFPVHFVATERPVWLRTRHGNNDSVKNRGASPPVEMDLPQALDMLKPDFPFIGGTALKLLSWQVAPPKPAEPAPADA